MSTHSFSATAVFSPSPSSWLKRYYGVRALFSILWVAIAFTIGQTQPTVGIILLVVYPAWDCLANVVDAARNGGLTANPTQALNVAVSGAVTFAVGAALSQDIHAAIGVIGVWAVLTGILQLATGMRRWREMSAQWPQILSGAQSCLGGTHFVLQAIHPATVVSAATIAPYAAFGAFYFAISVCVLAFKR